MAWRRGKPLSNITLKLGSKTAQTDASGRFLLASVEAGYQVLKVDGNSKSAGKDFGFYKIGLDIKAKQTNVLFPEQSAEPMTIWIA